MTWPKRYQAQAEEPHIAATWADSGVYYFQPNGDTPVYSIDTPPPSISGHLHLGHVYSYSHTDFVARYRRMRGDNVFYPMGFDDNGLPTERLVERTLGVRAAELGRAAFIEACLEASREFAAEYRTLWRRLGLSVDWRYTYDTIDDLSRRTAQRAFLDLTRRELAYRSEAPVIWCPECRTAIAQAEVDDLERGSELLTLEFALADGATLPIATTRPELLPACVAVFVHPNDPRYGDVVGHQACVPIFGQSVPVLVDERAQPDKGTGAVMCCTFGDTTDIEWWYTHQLPLRAIIARDGCLTEAAGVLAGLPVREARGAVKTALDQEGVLIAQRPIEQTVRVHDRCGTPVEYIVTRQWFIRVLPYKQELLEAGEQIRWHPEHMKARYREWVENLRWDWLISRQRYYGVPFPVWFCDCGEVLLADESQLPVDPSTQAPPRRCACGRQEYVPEEDVMDTWATSSLSPQIVGRQLTDRTLFDRVYPMSLRAQAHDIIRTWAFYTIVQSHLHENAVPWSDIMISGWGLSPQGAGKISKSKGGGPIGPMEALERYSADALRYWAASTALGKDAVINEEKIQAGAKLATKLWNVATFSRRFLEGFEPGAPPQISPADGWILSRLQHVVRRATLALDDLDYMAAKNEIEIFFWRDLADNYLEMAKRRLYDVTAPAHPGARFTLHRVLLTTLQIFAPILPFVTDRIYMSLFATPTGPESIHRTRWPEVQQELVDTEAERVGEAIVEIAGAVRRYKSDRALSLGAPLGRLEIEVADEVLRSALENATDDVLSVTRAEELVFPESLIRGGEILSVGGSFRLRIEP